tara:strand:+ start:98 stop:424 length:327 start_codon:yes stop_codon:yes gene_type:complete
MADKNGNYWSGNGTHELLGKELDELIPGSGSVDDPEENPQLERYRKIVNAYYDLFNNGGGNPCQKTAYFFPRTISLARHNAWDECYGITEPIMDKAILLAAKEQTKKD